MAPVITAVEVDVPSIDRQNSMQINVDATDCDYVVAIVNGVVFQLESRATGIYTTRFHASRVGAYTGTIKAVAIKTSTNEIDIMESSSIEISSVAPMMPAEFMVELYKAEGSYVWRGSDIEIVTERDERRFDIQNRLGVVVKEGKSIRQNKSKHHYKTVLYPLIIQVWHNQSYEECRRLFDEHILAVEEANVNLSGDDGYNWIQINDDGKPLPFINVFSIVHSVTLVKEMEKVNIDGY